jgi:hypothetical protein
MKRVIDLNEYQRLGGDISKLNFEKTTCKYMQGLRSKKNHFGMSLKSIKVDGTNETKTSVMYLCEFSDDTMHRYAGMWIETEVEMELNIKFI